MIRHIQCVLALFAVLCPSGATAKNGLRMAMEERAGDGPQRYVVMFKKREGLIQLSHALNGTSQEIKMLMDQKAAVMEMDPAEAQQMEARDDVEYVEKDQKVYMQAETTPYGIDLVDALQVDDDSVSNRKVCIVDSGYDISHPDLPKSVNSVTGVAGGAGPWDRDDDGHGTHVAGTIAAIGGNGRGVVGVNRNGQLKLHIVRVFNAEGFAWASDLVDAVNQCVIAGSNVINMSLGRGGNPMQYEDDAYKSFFENDNVLLVAAAGNSGNTNDNWPASYDAVISVGAVGSGKNLASFSQRTNQVELVAPGFEVLSTFPRNQYKSLSGTSMASPHVAGVAALVWSHFPIKSAAEIREALAATAEDLGPMGRDSSFGYGLVRAGEAYEYLGGGNTGGGDSGGGDTGGGDSDGGDTGDGDSGGIDDSPRTVEFRSRQDFDKCLDVEYLGTRFRNEVLLYPCDGTPAQQWIIDEQGYIRTALDFYKCLDVRLASTVRGTLVQVEDCSPGDTYQQWIYGDDGTIRPKNDTTKCIDILNEDGQTIHLWTCNDYDDKFWIAL